MKPSQALPTAHSGSEEVSSDQPQSSALLDFTCHICGMHERCRFGPIAVNSRTHTYKYAEEVYYLMNPFRNRNKVDEKRISEDNKSSGTRQSNSVTIFDFFVIGSLCAICGQSVCVDEACSVFYSKTFCSQCVLRERQYFPEEIVKQVEQTKNACKRKEQEQAKAKATNTTNG
ncbi:hypothetical protein AB6A40_007045 [Gnathostoma spinigerum]|uniref:Cysteine-rich DPF motif domain-containing protein 1 n=1 Tax=Gnathostoma spinigerum TaxID=75299 RepID=A0ABD6ESA2_9BILA